MVQIESRRRCFAKATQYSHYLAVLPAFGFAA